MEQNRWLSCKTKTCDKNLSYVEEIIIPPDKKEETLLNKLRQVF